MKDLTLLQNKRESFQEKLRARLSQSSRSSGKIPRTSALLLDVSGSMNDPIGANSTKLSELSKLAANFKVVRRVRFASTASEMAPNEELPSIAAGGTAIDVAFLEAKKLGISHLVMITDGLPDNQNRALEAARGLRIDVLYVGPDPAPPWLAALSQATGGQYSKATLEALPELEGAVRKLLPAPAKTIEL